MNVRILAAQKVGMRYKIIIFLFVIFGFLQLSAQSGDEKTIHIIVALCDNHSQNIAPVPAKIGNGFKPADNLYWGAYYGVKTVFNRNTEWKLVKSEKNPDNHILERLVYKNKYKNIYLIADAYVGNRIVNAVEDYLQACSGRLHRSVYIDGKTLNFGGESDLLAYVGHNALIEHDVSPYPINTSDKTRDAITLGCYSKKYFDEAIRVSGINPLIWTTGAMAPEAYILEGAIKGWVQRETDQQIRNRAAQAYSKYQKCSFNSAHNLLVTGW